MSQSIPQSGDFAQRLNAIEPFRVMALLARAKELEAQGKPVIHMEVGEPAFPSVEPVVTAAQQALEEGQTGYTPALGIPELRQKISDHYRQRFQVEVTPERIVITAGASGALMLLSALLVDEGKGLLVTDPGYPCNPHFLQVVGGEGHAVPVTAKTRYQLTANLVSQYWRDNTVGILAASPANPTGEILGLEGIRQLHKEATEKNGVLIVDEIYQGLNYDSTPQTALSVSDDIYVINSFSKYFCMTGWRLGWLVAPERAIPQLDKLAQNLFICAPTVSQYAALAAFDERSLDTFEQRRQEFQLRRDYLLPALQELGFGIPHVPEGAFYLYANISQFDLGAETFCQRLLEEYFVAVTPGTDFGDFNAGQHVRFAYTQSMKQLQQAVERIRQFIASL